MHYLVKKAFSPDSFYSARKDVECNQEYLVKYKRLDGEFKDTFSYNLYHKEFVKLKNLTSTMLSEKIIHHMKKNYKKVYLINWFIGIVNGYTHRIHRDGQGLGYTKDSLLKSEKIFKVVCYFNNYISDIISLNLFNFPPVKFFDNEKKFVKLNYYLDHYFKKKLLVDSGYQKCDALIFDSNTWHGTKIQKIFKTLDNKNVNKIYASYEIVVDDINVAKDYSYFQSEKYDLKTNYKNELNYLEKRLDLFDDILDL